MKIFISGGTGVIGRRLVPQLVNDGHSIGVLSRSDENTSQIIAMGATPISTDLFNADNLIDKTQGFEVFMHLATAIPKSSESNADDWNLNSRIRTEGTRNMLNAARANNVNYFIQQSAIMGYGHRGDQIINDELLPSKPVPRKVNFPDAYGHILDTIIEMEKMVRAAHGNGLETIILRFGMFYSYDSEIIENILQRNMVKIWRQNPYWSLISVDDAVTAIITTLRNLKSTTGNSYNIVDDKPVQSRDLLDYATSVADINSIPVVPGFLVKLLFGSFALNFLTSSIRVSNSQFKQSTGLVLKYPTYKDGIKGEIEQYKAVV